MKPIRIEEVESDRASKIPPGSVDDSAFLVTFDEARLLGARRPRVVRASTSWQRSEMEPDRPIPCGTHALTSQPRTRPHARVKADTFGCTGAALGRARRPSRAQPPALALSE